MVTREEALIEAQKRGLVPKENTDIKQLAIAEAKRRGLIKEDIEPQQTPQPEPVQQQPTVLGGYYKAPQAPTMPSQPESYNFVDKTISAGKRLATDVKDVTMQGVEGINSALGLQPAVEATKEAINYQEKASQIENINFRYEDLYKQIKSGLGSEKAQGEIQQKLKETDKQIADMLVGFGVDSVEKDNRGNLIAIIDGKETKLDGSFLEDLKASRTEMLADVGGGMAGAKLGQLLNKDPRKKLVTMFLGGVAGSATASMQARQIDMIRNAIQTRTKITREELKEAGRDAAIGSATLGIAGAGAIKGVAKVAKTTIGKPIGKVVTSLKEYIINGNINGAKKILKSDYNLNDKQIDDMFTDLSQDLKGIDDLQGDELVRAKLTAAIQQIPQGSAVIKEAIKRNEKGAINLSQEIDSRAKEINRAIKDIATKPSDIKKSLERYEKGVKGNYGRVRDLMRDSLPNYKYKIDSSSFSKTLEDINTRIIDPVVKTKLENLVTIIKQKESGNINELIDLRQLVNKFYRKNKSHFDLKPDMDSLEAIEKTLDNKIKTALETLPDDTSKGLKNAFEDAKVKYAEMYKTRDNVAFKSIFAEGKSEKEIAKSLIKYSKASDQTLEVVLNKIPHNQRQRTEFAMLNQIVDEATSKKETKAIDFTKLLAEIDEGKTAFKSKGAKQFIKNIETYSKKFGKDMELQQTAQGVVPTPGSNIAVSLIGKVKVGLATRAYEKILRLLPGDNAKRLALQYAIGKSLEKARTPKEFLFKLSKSKALPDLERKQLIKAVKEISFNAKKEAEIQAREEAKSQRKAKFEEAKRNEKLIKQRDLKTTPKKKPLNRRAQEIKEAKTPEIGGSEDEAKVKVKELFKKTDKPIHLTKKDVKELESIDLEEEANRLFVKGGDHMAAGLIAGVEEDDQGNISLNPKKFIAGLGGYAVAKRIAKSPKTKKILKFYTRKAIAKANKGEAETINALKK